MRVSWRLPSPEVASIGLDYIPTDPTDTRLYQCHKNRGMLHPSLLINANTRMTDEAYLDSYGIDTDEYQWDQ
jgi:hypothetical protein